jgi:hypothetical protein
MPGWRSLSSLTVIFGTILIWQFISVSNDSGNGFAVALSLGFVSCAGGGLISGVVTRTIFILFSKSKKNPVVVITIGIVGFVLLPSLIFALNKWQQWQRRPPSEACLTSKHPVNIGGTVYYLPSAPNFIIRTNMDSIHLFQFNQGIRTVCELSNDSSEPIHVINLSIDMMAKYKNHPYCQTPKRHRSHWEQNLCSSDSKPTEVNYPQQADISSPTEFNHRRMLASYSYTNFIEELERAKANKRPLEFQQVGIFNHYTNGYWVARDGLWKNTDGEPFTLNCYESEPAGTLGCSTSYLLKAGSQVTYQFRASNTDLEIVAKKVDENFRLMVVDLAAP